MKTPNGGAGAPNDDVMKVELNIPMRAEYVSIARLTAAGVANRAGFDIEVIEDIKVSLSEVCNRLIGIRGRCKGSVNGECKIEFVIAKDSLSINFYVEHCEEVSAFMADGAPARREAAPDTGAGAGAGGPGKPGESGKPGEPGVSGGSGCPDSPGGAEGVPGGDWMFDSHNMEAYEDHLQLSLITVLMDEFSINPNERCLVSMKKFLD